MLVKDVVFGRLYNEENAKGTSRFADTVSIGFVSSRQPSRQRLHAHIARKVVYGDEIRLPSRKSVDLQQMPARVRLKHFAQDQAIPMKRGDLRSQTAE